MKEENELQDKRIKKKLFPVATFLITFLVFAALTTIQMKIIGAYIDYQKVPAHSILTVVGFWIMGAVLFTLFTGYQIRTHYEKPIVDFAKATRKVASGDFSVYVPPRHTADKADELDVIFSDFNRMVEELGSIETLKTDFFSNVSHEIKTPIAVIQNYAELLSGGNLTEDRTKEYAESIGQATRKLSSLITNMLKLNKLEKQAIKPMPDSYDLCEQLCNCALQFEDQWEKKNIEFVADIEDRAMIFADQALMELVWTNLIANAIKFTSPGGTVTLYQRSKVDSVIVEVSDTGCGMSEVTVQHIFEKFYQGDTSHSTEGNGLGLALALRILQLMDASISVKSIQGEGAAFTVAIPTKGREIEQ